MAAARPVTDTPVLVASLGDALRDLRQARGLTQRDVAAAASEGLRGIAPGRKRMLTAAGLSRIEAGQRLPGLWTLMGLAHALEARIVIGPRGVRFEEAEDPRR